MRIVLFFNTDIHTSYLESAAILLLETKKVLTRDTDRQKNRQMLCLPAYA